MPEALSAALALPTLPALLAITLVAGVVYGFAGFGAALIFLPVATTLVDPVIAITAFSLSAMASLVTLVPRAWTECDRRVTLLMIGASALTLPLGVYFLRVLDQQVVQIAISLLAAGTLILLISGFRLPVRPGATSSAAVAGAAGVVGGATGLLGPIVILFNLASGDDARRVRANTMVFLTIGSLFVIPQMAFQGLITGAALWLGVLMVPAYAAGGLLGRALFNPGREGLYRNVAYTIIALAVLAGLSDFLLVRAMVLFPDITAQAVTWIAAAALVAGLVRGFSGFGTAMIFLPVAGQHLSPFAALTVLVVMDIVAPMAMVPRALRDGQPADVLRLGAGLAVAMPLGVWVLTLVEPDVFRYAVSVFTFGLLALLITGVRYRGVLTPPMVMGTGGLGGFLGGSVGLPGPPVILLYMASPLPAAAIRANITLYLILADIALLGALWLFDQLVLNALTLGVALILPYLAGIFIGGKLFRPGHEALYRGVAYAIIAASALSGLPVWD